MTGIAPWIAIAISIMILALIVVNNHVRPWRHAKKMRKPFSAYFRGVGDGKPAEVVLSAHTECHIQINRDVSVSHMEHELIIYFEKPRAGTPEIIGTKNLFMARGMKKERTPETDENEYVNVMGSYHIKRDNFVSKGNTYTTGYRLKTKEPGRYPLKIMTITEAGEGTSARDLLIIVQEPPRDFAPP